MRTLITQKQAHSKRHEGHSKKPHPNNKSYKVKQFNSHKPQYVHKHHDNRVRQRDTKKHHQQNNHNSAGGHKKLVRKFNGDRIIRKFREKPTVNPLSRKIFKRGKTFRLNTVPNNKHQSKHQTAGVKKFKKKVAHEKKDPESEEVTARKNRFNPDGETKKGKILKVGGRPQKGPKKEDLDEELEKYFLKNGQTDRVKQHLDDDLEEFMKKRQQEASNTLSTPGFQHQQSTTNLNSNTSMDFEAFSKNLSTTGQTLQAQ